MGNVCGVVCAFCNRQCELDVGGDRLLVLRGVRVSNLCRCCRCGSRLVLQIMFNLEKAHFILDEMVMNGYIVETNKISILKPIHLMEKSS